MRVRLKDLAKELDVSVSTVSSILRNRPNFNEVTRQRVLQRAKELSYSPNWVARSLVMQKTHVCGVVVPNLARSIFPDILDGIDAVTHSAGYHLVVSNTREDPRREDEEISTLIGKQVDGIIVASSRVPGKNAAKLLEELHIPLVLVDRQLASLPFVGADNEQIGVMATQHLIGQGYRNIAHLSRRNIATGFGRLHGFLKAMRAAGLRVKREYVMEVQGQAGGYEGTKHLLQLIRRPDAIFAASDPIAVGAMIAIQESGLRMPVDIGVIGVGNVPYGEYLRCPLSTVDQRSFEAGQSAASILLDILKGRPASRAPIFLEPTLIVRDSSCRIPPPERLTSRPRVKRSHGLA
jgi:LacI family transcriptional regulator